LKNNNLCTRWFQEILNSLEESSSEEMMSKAAQQICFQAKVKNVHFQSQLAFQDGAFPLITAIGLCSTNTGLIANERCQACLSKLHYSAHRKLFSVPFPFQPQRMQLRQRSQLSGKRHFLQHSTVRASATSEAPGLRGLACNEQKAS